MRQIKKSTVQYEIRRRDTQEFFQGTTANFQWEAQGGQIFKTRQSVLTTAHEFIGRAAPAGHRDLCPSASPAVADLEIVVYEFQEAGAFRVPV